MRYIKKHNQHIKKQVRPDFATVFIQHQKNLMSGNLRV